MGYNPLPPAHPTYEYDSHDSPPNMIDVDGFMPKTEAEFRARADRNEGINGQCPIDTEYENTREFWCEQPRSTMTDRPIRSEGGPGEPGNWGHKLAWGGRPNHEGVGNPAPVDTDKWQFPHRLR